MYTHAAARAEAARLQDRISEIEDALEEMENDTLADPEVARRLERTLERLERELDSLSMIDADPAAHGFGWAGDLDPRDTYYA